ncbi:glycohydrolase toxin TNT-related protein [Mycobacterium sp. NPDC050041]|uniref:glycohydrolase toxin TNT-related protein n=1 Tax=Mycobacterium sp. NPDC050041 TaxID=3364293 RepID=UPI003C2CB489
MRIEVDPEVLIGAGKTMGSLGGQLAALMGALGPMLSDGIASGLDPAGFEFALKYEDAAQKFSDGLAAAANAFNAVGYKLEASGHNYANADAVSTIGGAGPTGRVGEVPSETKAADAAAFPNFSVVPPPSHWNLILRFLALRQWPSGNPSLLRVTAEHWRNLAKGFAVIGNEVAGSRTAVSTQKIPESPQIAKAHDDLAAGVSDLASQASELVVLVEDFARVVQETQDAIRRLLERISLEGLLDFIGGIFTGEADDILREIAQDVQTLLENFQRQVKAVGGLLGELTEALGDTVTKLQKHVDVTLRELLGDEVGGAISAAFKVQTDLSTGVLTGAVNTVAGVVAMADIDTWQGMAETAWAVIQDPTKADDVAIAVAQEFFATDKITGDNPARGIGEAGFNVATLFVPGGALSKTGNVAKGVNWARHRFGSPDSPAPDTAPTFGSHDLEGLGDSSGLGTRPTDVTDVRPGAIPDSVIGPIPPNGVDAPPNPRGLEGPAGPPDPPSPQAGTPGGREDHGDGGGSGPPPPPDPPERTPGPSDSGPGRSDGPPPQSPASQGPSSGSADPPRTAPGHAPSADDPAPPATPQTLESSTPSDQLTSGGSPSETGSPTIHEPAAPEASAGGHAPEQHAGGTGTGEDSAQPPMVNDAPGESRQPDTDEHTARPDERTHTPADQQPANSPAAERPSGHERTGDGGQTREPAHAVGDSEAKRHEPAGVMPIGMGGFGTPMASHGSGSTSGSTNGSTAAPQTATPDAATRNPDGKGSQATSPESPRAQHPAATGPAAGDKPSAPVNTTKQPTAGIAGDSRLRESTDVTRHAIDGSPSNRIDAKNLDRSDSSTGHSTKPDVTLPDSSQAGASASASRQPETIGPSSSAITEQATDNRAEAGPTGRQVADPVRSSEPAGEGWKRLPDSFQDPAPSQTWPFTDNPVDPAAMNPDVARLIGDPAAPFGRDAQGNPFTPEAYAEQFHKLGPDGQKWVNFPENDGAVPNTKVAFSDFEQFKKYYGNRFDRIGDAKGKYFGLIEEGRPATWEERAMHVNSLREPYKTFTLDHLPEGWKIEISQIAAGLGQPGGGLQVRIMDERGVFQSIQQLATIDNGVVRVDKPS